MPGTVIDDARTLDPVSYIRQLGLQPEDSYGFVPMKLEEGSSLVYPYYPILDRTAKGRQENGDFQTWIRRRDEY